jgi:adenosine deaminase
MRAVSGYHIDYFRLKKMVRDSLEHGYMGGADLWTSPERFDAMVTVCKDQPLVPRPPSAACRAFLAANLRASLEWKEEAALARFEARF